VSSNPYGTKNTSGVNTEEKIEIGNPSPLKISEMEMEHDYDPENSENDANQIDFERSREENLLKSDGDEDEEDEINEDNFQQDSRKNSSPEKSRYTSLKRTVDPSAGQSKDDPGLNTKVSFNVVVNWGEEWKLCKGDAYPESVAALEGELDIPASDFEDLLSPEEKIEFNNLIRNEPDIEESLRLGVDISTDSNLARKNNVGGEEEIRSMQSKANQVKAMIDNLKVPGHLAGKVAGKFFFFWKGGDFLT
jgi:hypothetical protein